MSAVLGVGNTITASAFSGGRRAPTLAAKKLSHMDREILRSAN